MLPIALLQASHGRHGVVSGPTIFAIIWNGKDLHEGTISITRNVLLSLQSDSRWVSAISTA